MRRRNKILTLVGTLVVATCRPPEPPTLAETLGRRGAAADVAKAYLEVAMRGPTEERRRAALLWGLYACDVPSPTAALRAFSRAGPEGGLARLAARRLEDALNAGPSAAELWAAASTSQWAPSEARRRWRLRAAELAVVEGDERAAIRSLDSLTGGSVAEQGRALAVLVATSAGGEDAKRRLAIDYPRQFAASFPADQLSAMQRTFTPTEWRRQAEAFLTDGDAEEALRAARRGGTAAALTAARAALRLRRSREALAWADRIGGASVDGALERTEALRQLAWAGRRERRRDAFARVVAAATRAKGRTVEGSAAFRRADLLLAEASAELGRFADANEAIARSYEPGHQRWEWVWRRLAFLLAQHHKPYPLAEEDPPASTRVRRTVAFWRARAAGGEDGQEALRAVIRQGFPDLPGQWAAAELGERGVEVPIGAGEPAAPGPPSWASDLLTAGRVSDVVVAWRAELEQAGGEARGWLGLVRLAAMPPLDAIPLLIRGEPRLLSGPWAGLPRSLLEQYLPLLWRTEVEEAARGAGVPPWLLAGLVRHESAWNPQARSSAGAVGLAQVLPATGLEKARALGLRLPSRAAVAEPGTNLLLGAALLADWRRAFSGSWTAGLAAYNGGERRAREVFDLAKRSDGPEFVEALEIPETWDYVHRVVLLAEGYRLLYWPEGGPYPWT